MNKKTPSDRNKDFSSSGNIASTDELIFNLFRFGAILLIATFLWFILLMGGTH